jgi:predicted RNase H-like nuclease (RuvC/YqgF family)
MNPMVEAALNTVEVIESKNSELSAEVARLRAEVEGLRDALAPFAEFALIRTAAGKTSPKKGAVYSVHTRLGEAEITAEDFEAAFNAMGEGK